ncbi:MAG: hypothetical protein H0T87_05395 [Gammaproteobacteria bacterium]|nr:hypothetical protein [Gammaproteobacteria bacterium]
MAVAPKRTAKRLRPADRKHHYRVLQRAGAAMSPPSVPGSAFRLSANGGELIAMAI